MTSKETCYCEVCVVGTKYLKINKLNPQPRMANNKTYCEVGPKFLKIKTQTPPCSVGIHFFFF